MEDPGRVYTIQSARQTAGNNQDGNGAGHGHTNGIQSRFNFINIKSKGSIFKRSDFYKRLSILLCLLILFLFIGLIILIVKYNKRPQLCETDECLRSTTNLKLSINFSVNPCDDFYMFTCGKWEEEHPNHGWYPTFSSFRLIDERISVATLKFLRSNATDDEPEPVKGARALFQSCLNEGAKDKLGYTAVHKYIKQAGMPSVPALLKGSEEEGFKYDWIGFAAKIKKLFAMDLVFNFAIDADIYNRSHYVMYLSSNLGSSPLPSPFKSKKVKNKFLLSETENDEEAAAPDVPEEKTEDEVTEKAKPVFTGAKLAIHRIFTEIVKNSTDAVELSDETIENAIDIIWNITGDVLEIVNENDTTIDDTDLEKFTVAELQKLTDEFLKSKGLEPVDIWKPFLEELFTGVAGTFDFEKDYLFILKSELGEIQELAAHFAALPPIQVELYFWWKIVESMIAATTSDLNEFVYKHTSYEYIAYPDVARSRSLECAQLVGSYMGIAVTYGIADKNFANDTLPEVQQMLDDIKQAFEANVMKMTWMDAQTKKAAVEKSREMIGLIGFPEWLYNKTAIELYYANITLTPTTFLDNLMSIVSTFVPDMLAFYNEENVKQWRTDPNVVNAFHYVADNSINVPMAILTFPIYHLGLEVLNYGAIGSVLGHELTHGFDNMGKNFDKVGNMIQWWTNNTVATFDVKTQCFINQYNDFKYDKLNISVNGRNTLGENLADNGGLHQSFNAYQRYIERNGPEKRLPGFESFTNEQMFFIAFGSIWCEFPDAYSLIDQITNDEHAPSYDRVIGALQNSDDFAKAFKCPKGSRMNPKKEKCKIW